MTPEQLAALGIKPRKLIPRHDGNRNTSTDWYTHSDLMKVCTVYEARIQELEGALKEATSCGDWEPHIMRPISTTSPKAALEAYGKRCRLEALREALTEYYKPLKPVVESLETIVRRMADELEKEKS